MTKLGNKSFQLTKEVYTMYFVLHLNICFEYWLETYDIYKYIYLTLNYTPYIQKKSLQVTLLMIS